MIKGGYILQPRIFDISDSSKFPPCTREVWFYILRNVSHTDSGKFKRGSGFFNINDIIEALSWHVGYRKESYSKTQVAKALRRLREGLMIDTMKTTRGMMITVCNYEFYQDPKNYEGHNEGTTKASRRPSTDHTIYKNDKNEEDKNKDKKKTKKEKFDPVSFRPDWIEEKDWEDILIHRKKKKSAITERALKSLMKQLKVAAGYGFSVSDCVDKMTNRNWVGFEAGWMLDKKGNGKSNGLSKNSGYVEAGKKDYRA